MSNEKYIFNTFTHFYDEVTGEYIDKSKIGKEYEKTELVEKKVTRDDRNYKITITRIYGCRKATVVQLNLF